MRHELSSQHAFMTVGDYLRYIKGLTGTKIVCAEGDCGACTILVARVSGDKFTDYKSINSCIAKMYLMDRCHLLTVEGLGNSLDMHPVQETFVDAHGAQCGYCTPGFICAMAKLAQDLKQTGKDKTEQKVKNYLTGNLCRCTGYEPIIKAGMNLNLNQIENLSSLYQDEKILSELLKIKNEAILIEHEEKSIYLPVKIEEALEFKAKNTDLKMISGATDLGVVDNKNKIQLKKMLSLNNIESAYEINIQNDFVEIGAKVSLDDCEKKLKSIYPEFTRMLHIFASPQIKYAGTLVGNLVKASPIADTIPFLIVAKAKIEIVSMTNKRVIEIADFFKGGYKELDLKVDELVSKIIIPRDEREYKLYKVSLRRDLDISAVTFAASYTRDQKKLTHLSLAYGGVGATVLRMLDLEKKLNNKELSLALIKDSAKEIPTLLSPLSDHRGSREFRLTICQNLLHRFYDDVSGNHEASL